MKIAVLLKLPPAILPLAKIIFLRVLYLGVDMMSLLVSTTFTVFYCTQKLSIILSVIFYSVLKLN